MKKTDIASLVLVVVVVGALVFVLLRVVFGSATAKSVTVEVAKPITTDLVEPSASIFNENAINPTVPITIEGGNQKPIGN